jgi:hypothetical protein
VVGWIREVGEDLLLGDLVVDPAQQGGDRMMLLLCLSHRFLLRRFQAMEPTRRRHVDYPAGNRFEIGAWRRS